MPKDLVYKGLFEEFKSYVKSGGTSEKFIDKKKLTMKTKPTSQTIKNWAKKLTKKVLL